MKHNDYLKTILLLFLTQNLTNPSTAFLLPIHTLPPAPASSRPLPITAARRSATTTTTTTSEANDNDTGILLYGGVSVPGEDSDRPQKVNQDRYFSFLLDTPTTDAYTGDNVLLTSDKGDGDDMRIHYILNKRIRIYVLGVMDGHGLKGHLVTEYLAQQLPLRIQENMMKGLLSGSNISDIDDCDDGDAVLTSLISQTLNQSFRQVHDDALLNPTVPAGRSGTTCIVSVVVVVNNDDENDDCKRRVHVVTANVGDSSAFLCTQSTAAVIGRNNDKQVSDGSVTALTSKTVTQRDDERQRVETVMEESARDGEQGGRIDVMGNVWYGPVAIAMTRALGDGVMKRAGVIPDPEITTHWLSLPEKDDSMTIVLATDGVWDMLNVTSVMEIVREEMQMGEAACQKEDVNNNKLAEKAARAVVDVAREKWRGPFMDVKIDDATCIVFST